MAQFKVNDILGKLNELRAVFVLGQRALPFIEEIFSFMKEVAPLIEEINASMMDSALMMPHATSQLQSISEATRTASTEILDLIDSVMLHSDAYESNLDQSLSDVKKVEQLNRESLQHLRQALADRPEVLSAVEAHYEESAAHLHHIEGSIHARQTIIDEIRGQMNRIGHSLQVQDCTAQQIASVNHLLDNMRNRMADLLERLDAQASPEQYEPTWEVPPDAPFNPHARYEPTDEKQDAADALIQSLRRQVGGHSGDESVERIFESAALAMQQRKSGGNGEH